MTQIATNSKDIPQDISQDYLLGGRVLVRQPAKGYRVAIDTVLLAAAVSAKPGETVLDVGAGVGAASLCLATRLQDIRILGVELQRDYVRMAFDNMKLNNLSSRIEILNGDLQRPPPRLAAGTFSHVMSNPPFFESNSGRLSPNMGKLNANMTQTATLNQWIKFCLLMTKPKGVLTLIYTSDRLDELLAELNGKVGDIELFPLWPATKKEAKRFIVRGVKGSFGKTRIMPGLVLHDGAGNYTLEAENILRHAQALNIG